MQVRTLLGFGISEDIGVGEYIDRHEYIDECEDIGSDRDICELVLHLMAMLMLEAVQFSLCMVSPWRV